jgi:hypothetical protein
VQDRLEHGVQELLFLAVRRPKQVGGLQDFPEQFIGSGLGKFDVIQGQPKRTPPAIALAVAAEQAVD